MKKWEVMMQRPAHSLKQDKVVKELRKTESDIEQLDSLAPVVKERLTDQLADIEKWLNYYFKKQQ